VSEFKAYVASESRIKRLAPLQVESRSELSSLTKRRIRLEARLAEVKASEDRERADLQALTNRIQELTTDAQKPFVDALSLADTSVEHIDLSDTAVDDTQVNTIVNGPASLDNTEN